MNEQTEEQKKKHIHKKEKWRTVIYIWCRRKTTRWLFSLEISICDFIFPISQISALYRPFSRISSHLRRKYFFLLNWRRWNRQKKKLTRFLWPLIRSHFSVLSWTKDKMLLVFNLSIRFFVFSPIVSLDFFFSFFQWIISRMNSLFFAVEFSNFSLWLWCTP